MAEPDVWCQITVVGPDGEEREHWRLSGPGAPDLAALDVLAHLQLATGRDGGRLLIDQLCPALADLLKLAGLRVEVLGQTEEREDRLGVEEEVESDDPPG